MALTILLACPACGDSGSWTVRGRGEVWTAPDGREVPVVAGECDRCSSLAILDPSLEAVEHLKFRELARQQRAAEARAALASVAAAADRG